MAIWLAHPANERARVEPSGFDYAPVRLRSPMPDPTKETKSKKERRRIELSAFSLAALHEYRKRLHIEGRAGGTVIEKPAATKLNGILGNLPLRPCKPRSK